jgi:hypothetical protein
MATIWDDLLAADDMARRHGAGGMHPRLRKAIEASTTFASRSSGPVVVADPVTAGENVVWLHGADVLPKRGRA